jgi:hypothetical protein
MRRPGENAGQLALYPEDFEPHQAPLSVRRPVPGVAVLGGEPDDEDEDQKRELPGDSHEICSQFSVIPASVNFNAVGLASTAGTALGLTTGTSTAAGNTTAPGGMYTLPALTKPPAALNVRMAPPYE